MSTPPEGYRHLTPIDIRFGDLDAMGHVNNSKYLTYTESARINYFRDLGIWDGIPRLIGPIMAKVTIEYKIPLDLSDVRVEVYTRVSRLGNKSYTIDHQIIRYKDERPEVAAYCEVVVVAFDYQAGKSILVPDSWREKMIAYEPLLAQMNNPS
jgi:acyl-CoA thioester hydrolase